MTSSIRTRIIGTAGHIDHGKTSLVRMLTGVELDTAPEEQQRGITIALGFTAIEHAGERIAWIDVPGHERLIRTMIAGATGLDGAVLVVSAIDGVMPQTREHLAILELLGVKHGVVALTMADLVDDELLELAQVDIEDAVAGTFLEGAPVFPTSTIDHRNQTELLDAIAALPIDRRASEGPFRLPIDRAFLRPGFGTVVTGTTVSGSVEDGAAVYLLPSGTSARVRGIQVHGEPRPRAQAGERTAINLAGIDRSEVSRGEVVSTTLLPATQMIDVLYTHLPSAEPLVDGLQIRMLCGTAEALGRIHLASADDRVVEGTVPAQLRLEAPLVCWPGDRFVIRRTSPLETLGGGGIVDPWAPRMRKRDRARVATEIARLDAGDTLVWLERAGDLGLSEAEWSARGGQGGVAIAGRVLAPAVVERFEHALTQALDVFHRNNPLVPGANRRELRREALAHLPEKLFDAVVEGAAGLVAEGPWLRLQDFSIQLDPAQRQAHDALYTAIADQGLAGATNSALHTAHPGDQTSPLLHLLEAEGRTHQVANLGWVATEVLEGLLDELRGWFETHDRVTPGEFKELTGLTRKAAIPLLEWCDKHRYTQFHEAGQRARGSQLQRKTTP